MKNNAQTWHNFKNPRKIPGREIQIGNLRFEIADDQDLWLEISPYRRTGAFTLVELLVVITIIALVAALVLNAASSAAITKKRVRVNAEKGALVNMIEDYKSKLNFYPPDNGLLATTNPLYYDGCAATNPLIYELTGVTNTNSTQAIVFYNNPSTGVVNDSSFVAAFNRGGIANSDSTQPHNFFFPPPGTNSSALFQYAQYAQYGSDNIYGLTVPVDLAPGVPNFWHYDSSSSRRHNPNSYDLWAEYEIGRKNGALVVITNGNW